MPQSKNRLARIKEVLTQPVGKPRLPSSSRKSAGGDAAPPEEALAPADDLLARSEGGSPAAPGPLEGASETGTHDQPEVAQPTAGLGEASPGLDEAPTAVSEVPPGAGAADTEHPGAAGAVGAAGAAGETEAAGGGLRGRMRRARPQPRRRAPANGVRRPAMPVRRPARMAAPRLSRVDVAGLPQVSPVLAVLLLAVVILLLVWLIALRPGSSSNSTSASAPAVTTPSVTTPTTTQRIVPGRGHVVHRSGTRNGIPRPANTNGQIIQALSAHKVVALLVSNPGGADDDAVRAELSGLSYSPQRVLKVTVPTNQIAQLPVITASVAVNQTPTFVIIDRARTVTTIVGYADPFELSTRINQALVSPVSNAPGLKLHPPAHRLRKHKRKP